MKRRIFYGTLVAVACLVIPFSSCSKDDKEAESEHPTAILPSSSNQRVLVAYLIGNNTLKEDIDRNLVWMYEGLAKTQTPSVLMVFYRSTNTSPVVLGYCSDGKGAINEEKALSEAELNMDGSNDYEISSKISQAREKVVSKAVKVKTYPDQDTDGSPYDSTNPAHMRTILKDIKNAVSAPSYGLIFGAHATGWLPSGKSRALGVDYWTTRLIDIDEIATVVGDVFGKDSDKGIDYIIFDACMMANAETCYELKDVSHYLLGSVIETPANGLPYQKILPSLYNHGELSGTLSNCVDQYMAFTKDFLAGQAFGAYTVIDCDKMQGLANAVKRQLGDNQGQWNTSDVPLYAATQYGQGSYKGYSYDMMDIMSSLNQGSVPDDFSEAFHEAVKYTSCIKDGKYISSAANYNGLGFYPYGIVTGNSSWNQYFKTTKWYYAAGFDQIDLQ